MRETSDDDSFEEFEDGENNYVPGNHHQPRNQNRASSHMNKQTRA
jgi:hypothetical protein